MTFPQAGDIDYGAVLLGMLVTQDVQLGLFMAVLPTLIQAGAGAHARYGCCSTSVHGLFFWLQIICLSKYRPSFPSQVQGFFCSVSFLLEDSGHSFMVSLLPMAGSLVFLI